jgi:hypothetical protein
MVIEVKEGLFEGAAVAAEDGEHAAELGDGGEAGGVPGVRGGLGRGRSLRAIGVMGLHGRLLC